MKLRVAGTPGYNKWTIGCRDDSSSAAPSFPKAAMAKAASSAPLSKASIASAAAGATPSLSKAAAAAAAPLSKAAVAASIFGAPVAAAAPTLSKAAAIPSLPSLSNPSLTKAAAAPALSKAGLPLLPFGKAATPSLSKAANIFPSKAGILAARVPLVTNTPVMAKGKGKEAVKGGPKLGSQPPDWAKIAQKGAQIAGAKPIGQQPLQELQSKLVTSQTELAELRSMQARKDSQDNQSGLVAQSVPHVTDAVSLEQARRWDHMQLLVLRIQEQWQCSPDQLEGKDLKKMGEDVQMELVEHQRREEKRRIEERLLEERQSRAKEQKRQRDIQAVTDRLTQQPKSVAALELLGGVTPESADLLRVLSRPAAEKGDE